MRVKVVDANDNAPAFMQARYDLVVPENAPQTVIHTVVARDADEGDNGRITYSIIGEETGTPTVQLNINSS